MQEKFTKKLYKKKEFENIYFIGYCEDRQKSGDNAVTFRDHRAYVNLRYVLSGE